MGENYMGGAYGMHGKRESSIEKYSEFFLENWLFGRSTCIKKNYIKM
jgi:hypothetical protein